MINGNDCGSKTTPLVGSGFADPKALNEAKEAAAHHSARATAAEHKVGELWRTVTRLGEKYDRASATATKRLDCMQWILAVCKAPEVTLGHRAPYTFLDAARKIEMIEQLLRRRAITEQSIGAPPASTPTDGSDAKPSPATPVTPPPTASGLGNFEEESE